MSADFRESIRVERREHTRASEQRRQVARGDIVRYFACGCSDHGHHGYDRMDEVADVEAAFEDALGMGVRHAHVLRVELSAVDR